MTYDEVVEALQVLNEVPLNNSDDNFQRIIPAMFLYANGRIYRELTFFVVTQPGVLTAFNRELVLPASVRVLRGINVITAVGTTVSVTSKRKSLERVPPDILDFFWPDPNFHPAMPVKYAVIGAALPDSVTAPQTLEYVIRFMPTPDQNYPVEFLGEIRPLPLSPSNPQTFLSVNYPELFLACCMIFASGYQRDFSAQSDDPARAQSWEAQYGILRASAVLEAARMRGEGPGYTSDVPAPAAQARSP